MTEHDEQPPRRSAHDQRRAMLRHDARLENAWTGMGTRCADSAEHTVLRGVTYDPERARREYRYSWAARREIERPATDLVSQRPTLKGLPENVSEAEVWAYLDGIRYGDQPEDRGALQALGELYGEGFKTGGAAAVLVPVDGLDAWEPLDLTRVESLEAILILERDEITPYRTAPSAAPEYYVINAWRSASIQAAQIVHASRVILARGARLSPREEYQNEGWGASALEQTHDERRAMHTANQETGSLAGKVNQDVLYMAELSEMLTSTEGEAAVDARLALIARARGQHRPIPLDNGSNGGGPNDEPGRPADKLEALERPVRGVADLSISTADHWAGATGQTPSIALGKNVGGLNTGENAGDWQSWGSYIDGQRSTWLAPRLDRVLEVVFAAADGPSGGVVPDSWQQEYPSLWAMGELEKAQLRAANATTDNIYVQMRALPVEVVTQQRFVEGNEDAISLDALPAGEGGGEVEPGPTDPEELDPDAPVEPEDVPEEPEPTEADIAWSEAQPPDDAATASDLADDLGVTAQLVHRVARDYSVTAYPKPGYPSVPLYSLQDIKAALVKRQNGEPPDDVDEELDRADIHKAAKP